MKKGFFGGTFDPIHNGHIAIAYEALNKLNLDKVLFIPAGNPPHKINREVTDAKSRYDMVKKAIENEPSFQIDDFEVYKIGMSYTFETLQYLNLKEKHTKWYFITGVDCLFDIETWKKVNIILELSQLVVFNRPGYSLENIMKQKAIIEEKYGTNIIFLNILAMDISSTDIREKIKNGEDTSKLIPRGAYEIIENHKLYKF